MNGGSINLLKNTRL